MDTFVRMSRALLSVPFLYALSALTLCSVLCVVVSCLSFSFSTRPQLTRWWVDALFFFCFLLAIILLALCAFDLFSFSFTCLSSIITFILDTTTTVLYQRCYVILLALIYNVWMFVMCMYPSTLTCLMLCLFLCSCCCRPPNPDLLLSHVVVFHKLVYIYIIVYVNVS